MELMRLPLLYLMSMESPGPDECECHPRAGDAVVVDAAVAVADAVVDDELT